MRLLVLLFSIFFILILSANIFADTNVSNNATTTISNQFATSTITDLTTKEKWRYPISFSITILDKQYRVDIVFLPSNGKYEAIIYLDDRELVLFFEKAIDWEDAIISKIVRVLKKDIRTNINMATIVEEIEKLSIPVKE